MAALLYHKDFVQTSKGVFDHHEDSIEIQDITQDSSTSSEQDAHLLEEPCTSYNQISCNQVPEEYMPLQTCVIIGEEGRRVVLDKCVIDIPPGALKEYEDFTFTLIYKTDSEELHNEKKEPGKLLLTPLLECDPDYTFLKPVKITLPACYAPARPNVLVWPKTYDGKDWADLPSVTCGNDHLISFSTTSFCFKKTVGDRQDFPTKRLLFKCSKVAENTASPKIKWTVVNGNVDTSDDDFLALFYIDDVDVAQDLILKMKSADVRMTSSETLIFSEDLMQEQTYFTWPVSTVVKRKLLNSQKLNFQYEVCYHGTVALLKHGKFSLTAQLVPVQKNKNGIDATTATAIDLFKRNLKVQPALQEDYDRHLGNEKIFQIVSNPKGLVLIMSNIKFEKLKLRSSGDEEYQAAEKLFEELGCQVQLAINLKAAGMIERAKEFSENSRHTDFCVVFVMSHGTELQKMGTVFFGSDDKEVAVSTLEKIFRNENINEKLKRKPRILFIQCCRKARDKHVKYRKQGDELQRVQEKKPKTNAAEFLSLLSTSEGQTSHRTFLTYTIVEVFCKEAGSKDLLEMIRQVQKEMYNKQKSSKNKVVQQPKMTSNIWKELFFFPGITPGN